METTTTILEKITEAKKSNRKIAFMGLRISKENTGASTVFYETFEELEIAINEIDLTKWEVNFMNFCDYKFITLSVYLKPIVIKVVSEKSKLFKTAWQLAKTTKKSFAVCLAKAWNLFRLRKKLQTNDIVKFAYEKADGSLRIAFGTLKNVSNMVKGTGKEILSTMNYFDVEAQQFRSFRIDNLITIY
jgi:WYL_2, Sm-like SH3 beta-barrel fold